MRCALSSVSSATPTPATILPPPGSPDVINAYRNRIRRGRLHIEHRALPRDDGLHRPPIQRYNSDQTHAHVAHNEHHANIDFDTHEKYDASANHYDNGAGQPDRAASRW
jgi:hypothetical protein